MEEFKIKSAEEITAMTDAEKANYIVAKNAHEIAELNAKHEAALEGKVSKEELEALKTDLGKLKDARVDALENTLKSQGAEMAKLVDMVNSKSTEESKDFKGALLEALNAKTDNIKELVKKGAGVVTLDIKAEQTAADINSGTDFAMMESGVSQIPTRKPFIRELFVNANTDKEYIKYTEQDTIVRDAKNVAGCAPSTHNSKVTWVVNQIQISKIRDFVDVCVDMMDDYSFVTSEITGLVSTDVQLKADSQLLLGTGVYPELNSVDSTASTFAAGSYATSVAVPTIADLIKVVGCQISDLGQNNAYNANYALLNPIDACLMQLEKDANGNYLLPSWVTQDGVQIGAIKVVTNNLVPANTLYVGDFTKGTVFSRKGATVELAFENNDNFEREVVTVKAYERLNLRIKSNDANAFMKVTDIAAALTAITKP